MEPIDSGYERLRALIPEVVAYMGSVQTEADTRLKVIDRILTEVLHWPLDQVMTEQPADSGFADYACKVGDRFRLILEAKKDGRSLGIESRPAGSAFKLSGPVFGDANAREGLTQAMRYCGAKNTELACVTNGREWIVLRGGRNGDGLDSWDGHAFVFPTLTSVEEQFQLFYDLLSYEACQRFNFRARFQEAEGQPIRTSVFQKAYRASGSAKFIRGGDLSADTERIMTSFFERLSGDQDPTMIEQCFVTSAESEYADTHLAKIAESIVDRIQDLDTGSGEQLVNVIERVHAAQSHGFVLIVGTKGAGKSTFVTRFFSKVMSRRLSSKCEVIRLDLGITDGDQSKLASWLDQRLIEVCEKELFDGGAPTFAELQGMFFDEYTRLRKGPLADLYDADRAAFHIRFGDRIDDWRTNRQQDYIQGLIRHIVSSKLCLPVFVFDNSDQFDIEFQQRVYQYARSIYEQSICLIILPITDRTSWQLTKHGSLQSFEHEALFLPTPKTEAIIRKRIEFIDSKIAIERQRGQGEYFTSRGITLDIKNIEAFVRSLQRVFLQESETSRWIGELANHDLRRTLGLAKSLISSPHLKVEDLVKAHLAGENQVIPSWRVARALIRGHYDIYPAKQHSLVQNIYALNSDLPTTPLLALRILQLLADVPPREHEGAAIQVSEVSAYFAGMNIDSRPVLLWLDEMLQTGLVLNYDPTVRTVDEAGSVEISPAGARHLAWGTGNMQYTAAMAEVTPVLTEEVFKALRYDIRPHDWRARAARFIDYLAVEDAMYCTIPDNPSFQSQTRILPMLQRTAAQLRQFQSSGR